VFGRDRATYAEAGSIPINHAAHDGRFARQSDGHIRYRGADANAAALDAGALARILVVIRFGAVVVIAGLMVGVTMTLCTGFGRNGVGRSSPDHAACDEGERDDQDYEPSPKGLHYEDATLLAAHQSIEAIGHSLVVRRRRALPITSTELRLMAALAIIGFSNRPKAG
jgi:hypothetical protein